MNDSDIMVFDVETTGTDRRRDQVIELCIQRGLESDAVSKTWRIKPSVSIHPGAQAVHGISMADLADCPRFEVFADEFRALFAQAQVLVGYNMLFDVGMLQAEYQRLRQPGLDLRGKHMVDAFRLWQQCEPRSLMHAHQRFVGDTFSAAHSASADVAATGRVLRGMIDAFGLSGRDWNNIADVCEPERASWVGPSRHVRWTSHGHVVIGFGRHAGAPVHMLANSPDRDYLNWILDKDFPPHVHAICQRAMAMPSADFQAWIASVFGQNPFAPSPPRRPALGERPADGSERTSADPSSAGAEPRPHPNARP